MDQPWPPTSFSQAETREEEKGSISGQMNWIDRSNRGLRPKSGWQGPHLTHPSHMKESVSLLFVSLDCSLFASFFLTSKHHPHLLRLIATTCFHLLYPRQRERERPSCLAATASPPIWPPFPLYFQGPPNPSSSLESLKQLCLARPIRPHDHDNPGNHLDSISNLCSAYCRGNGSAA